MRVDPVSRLAATIALFGAVLSASPGAQAALACGEPVDLRPVASPPPDGCVRVALPVPLERVRWAGWLPAVRLDPSSRLALTGTRRGGAFVPAAIDAMPAVPGPDRPAPLPIGRALLDGLTARPFGVEERVLVERVDGRLTLRCRPGAKPAGLVLDPGPRRLPDEASLVLTWRAEGDPGFAGAIAARDAPEARGATALRSAEPTTAPVPADDRLRGAPIFVLTCPGFEAALALVDLRLGPDPGPAAAAPSRSAWAWAPRLWRDEPDRLLARASALRVGRLFVAVEIEAGRIGDEAAFASFVGRARDLGIEVAVVEGDPGMALPAGRRVALERLAALTAYQERTPPASRLAGLQYDIEPYLLPAYRSDPGAVRSGWAATVTALHEAAHGVPLDLVLPFWLADDAQAEATVLPAVARAASRVTVMAYRTEGAAIQAAAEPLLAWASRNRMPLHVALEAGPVEDEATQVYAPARGGAMHLAPQEDGRTLVLLLDAPIADESGAARAYALAHEVATPADRVSFFGDEARLIGEAAAAAEAFRAWPAFVGLALHGLIE